MPPGLRRSQARVAAPADLVRVAGPQAGRWNARTLRAVVCGREVPMRYLTIAVLLLAVTFGTQACIFVPVPVGGGGGHHHRHHDDWR